MSFSAGYLSVMCWGEVAGVAKLICVGKPQLPSDPQEALDRNPLAAAFFGSRICIRSNNP